jgi:hypothetical protein
MAGRPTDYRKEYCELLIEHMGNGLSFESFAAVVNASKQTLYDWAEANPEFLDSKNIAFERSRLFWERVGIDIAVKGEGNATAYIFNMKNRFKQEWRDKVETGITDGDGNDREIVSFYIPNNGRHQYETKGNQAAAGVSGEGS